MKKNTQGNEPAETEEDTKPALIHAFERFQEQSIKLEESYSKLNEKLKTAEISLAEKNNELAVKLTEIENGKEKLSSILEAITEAIFLVKKNGSIETCNNSAKKLINKGFDLNSLNLSLNNRTLGDIETPVSDVDISLTIQGTEKTFMVSLIPIKSSNKSNVKEKVISIKDITEHRLLEKRLAQEDRLAALGRVAASVAHEIRNPLTGIEGFASLLVRDLKDQPATQRLAEKTVYATRLLNHVVSNLLSHTREIKCNKTINNINNLILETVELVKLAADDQQIKLNLKLSDQSIYSAVDSHLFKQVITNILLNAIDACPIKQNGKIVVKSYKENQNIFIEFIDNGCGMSAEVSNRIFEPFYTKKDGGVGLGLALCEKIIEAHLGQITVTSKLGIGTTFTITLPFIK